MRGRIQYIFSNIKTVLFLFSACIILLVTLSSCRAEENEFSGDADASEAQALASERGWSENEMAVFEQQNFDKETLEEGYIHDRSDWYEGYDNDAIITMHLTVSAGNEGDGTNHTWTEVNTYSAYDYLEWGEDRYKVEGILEIEEEGGKTAYSSKDGVPNVTVQVRGQTSSIGDQKSLKIRIKKGCGEYSGQRTLALNKHRDIPLRYSNKLAYDLLSEIPQVLSSHVRFVHLFVTDTTKGGSGSEEDYGLYTMVEQGNKTFLENHGLDKRGQLFKVTMFEWRDEEAVRQDTNAVGFDEEAFEEFLEIKGDRDTALLNKVQDKINNYLIPITEIIEEHFDSDNLLYWVASQILIGNSDTGPRNLFLYSPLNSEKFYIIPWDMDVSFRRQFCEEKNYSEGGSWENGITQFVATRLFERMFKEPEYVDKLTAIVNELYAGVISPEHVQELADRYEKIIEPFVKKDPDRSTSLTTIDEIRKYTAGLGGEIRQNYDLYMESLKKPWPFFVDLPRKNGNQFIFSWGVSYSPNDEEVSYDFILADNYEFKKPIAEARDLNVPVAKTDLLSPGTYYIKVTATNESGYVIDCFDWFPIEGRGQIYGCYCFVLEEDGTFRAYDDEVDE